VLKSLRLRVLRTIWGPSAVYFPFGAAYDREPIGWKDADGNVHDEPVPGAVPGNWHRGEDYPLPSGTPVQAALAGTCTYAGWSDLGYGTLVTVEGGRYKCRYAHLSKAYPQVGDHIKGNEYIGLSGATGNVTGPHLHFEVYDKLLGAYVDPLR
jgi:murein DD-endopeptidase MepM/ murein hydrolase activator NlpD